MWIVGYVIVGLVAAIAVTIGLRAVLRRQIKIGDKEYEGARARMIGIELIVIGVGLFGLFVFLFLLAGSV